MQRCRHQLHRRGCDKLRRTRTAHVTLYALAHVLFETRREQRREIEGREYGHAVADSEEGKCGEWDGARGPSGAEELGEFVVFVEAEGEIGSRGCEELGRPGGRGGRRFRVDG
jgi:hypothetical protein